MSIRGRGGIPALICGVVLAIGVFGWDRWFDQHGKGLFLAAAGVFLVLLEVRSGLHIRELLTTGEPDPVLRTGVVW